MGKKMKRFLIICGIVVGAGLILTTIGAASGGLEGIDKLSSRYTWIAGPSVEEDEQSLDPAQTFDAVKVSGDLDVTVMRGSEDSAKIIYPKGKGSGSLTVENGTLVAEYTNQQSVIINLASEDDSPRLVITRKDPASIRSIETDVSYGDVTLENIAVETAVLKSEDGDVELSGAQIGTLKADLEYGDLDGENVTCTTITATLEDGDCELDGIFDGNITVTSQYGDVEIHTTAAESQYTVTAETDFGTVEISGREYDDGGRVTFGSGASQMNLKADDGDISVRFGK